MDIGHLTFGFDALRWFVLGGVGIYAWVVGRQSASAKELTDLRARILRLEAEMRQVPSQQQLHELAMQMTRMAGSVESLAERITPIGKAVERLDNFLLHQKTAR